MHEITRLISDCLADDPNTRQAARRAFQDEYSAAIYNFPLKLGGCPEADAGEFYLYVFENDRLFLRLRTFQGRNHIQFRTFLSYYVLKTLFWEWLRMRRDLETVSLDAPLDDKEEGNTQTLQDVLPSEEQDPINEAGERSALAQHILTTL